MPTNEAKAVEPPARRATEDAELRASGFKMPTASGKVPVGAGTLPVIGSRPSK